MSKAILAKLKEFKEGESCQVHWTDASADPTEEATAKDLLREHKSATYWTEGKVVGIKRGDFVMTSDRADHGEKTFRGTLIIPIVLIDKVQESLGWRTV